MSESTLQKFLSTINEMELCGSTPALRQKLHRLKQQLNNPTSRQQLIGVHCGNISKQDRQDIKLLKALKILQKKLAKEDANG